MQPLIMSFEGKTVGLRGYASSPPEWRSWISDVSPLSEISRLHVSLIPLFYIIISSFVLVQESVALSV